MNRWELLTAFKWLADEIKNIPTSSKYWDLEEKIMEERIENSKKVKDSLKMSYQKLNTKFTI